MVRKLEKNKPKQRENVPCFGFGTILPFRGWGGGRGVLVLVKLQAILQLSLELTYFHRCFHVL